MGRPSSYKPKYCKEIVDFFTQELYREVEEVYTYKDGTTKTTYKQVANDPIFMSDFIAKIGTSRTTINRWIEKFEEFRDAYKRAEELRNQHIIGNALLSNYHATFSIFTLKNIANWKDSPATSIDQSKHYHFTTVVEELHATAKGSNDTARKSTGDINPLER